MPKPRPRPEPAPARPPAPDVTRPANIVGVFGASGSGKSAYIKQRLASAGAPVMIFDPCHEYTASGRASIFDDEARMYRFINEGGAALVFRPSMDADIRDRQFNRFCLAALAVARNRGRCTIVVDELQTVVGSGNAPAGWNEVVLTGRKYGVIVIAASSRPALINKDFWANCTLVRSGRPGIFDDDVRTVSRALGVDAADLAALRAPPAAPGCDWIERDMLTGETRRGRLTF